jgi:protoheme IX farnesyltransferase
MKGGLKPINTGGKVTDETIRGTAPTVTVGETYAPDPVGGFEDFLTLTKVRVTSLVVLTSCAGAYLAEKKLGLSSLWIYPKVIVGVGLVSSAAAALNQVLECEADARMSRTKNRPLPAGRMTSATATVIALVMLAAGVATLSLLANMLSGALALATFAAYAFIYTPLKKLTPASTFVGAFPGAMPALLGWTAVTGRLEWEAFALFAIVFVWQFPHFLSIAWLYREDYERAHIRMRPVIDPTGKLTIIEILFYGLLLIPVSALPYFLFMSGKLYLVGANILSLAYFAFGIRLAWLRLPPSAAYSKKYARHLLQASVAYLPLLFIFLLLSSRTD